MIALTVDQLQQREGRWVIPDLEGKGGRIRTIPIPSLVKVRIDEWLASAAITEGRIFRSVDKGDAVVGEGNADEKAIWRLVVDYAARLRSVLSLRMTSAERVRSYVAKPVETSSRSSCCSGMLLLLRRNAT